jgi:hypothetical protein
MSQVERHSFLKDYNPEEEPTREEHFNEKSILMKTIREQRDKIKELEQELYDYRMKEKQDRIAHISPPDLRDASEFSKTDFLRGNPKWISG